MSVNKLQSIQKNLPLHPLNVLKTLIGNNYKCIHISTLEVLILYETKNAKFQNQLICIYAEYDIRITA